ncbi:hypothetical protein ACIQ7Q_34865 [Streptomyces sp. NPDC096176]|uniref:hypothetical protein n=1 Tax=Streptomyces sp. NPDC096176 TaxID=3366079 RepID=UPI00381CA983
MTQARRPDDFACKPLHPRWHTVMDGGLDPETIGDVITRLGRWADLTSGPPATPPAGGLATSSERASNDRKEIAKQGGWADNSAAMEGYFEDADGGGEISAADPVVHDPPIKGRRTGCGANPPVLQRVATSRPSVRDGGTFPLTTLFEDSLMDALLALPWILGLGVLCAAFVCIVALFRADRTDTVAVVKALPELAATFLRYRRGTRR